MPRHVFTHAPAPLSHGAQRLHGKRVLLSRFEQTEVFRAVGIGREIVNLAPAVVPRRQLGGGELGGKGHVGECEAAEGNVLGRFNDGLGLAVEQS